MIPEEVSIRKGKKEDLPKILELINELALYEKAPHEVIVTVDELEKDGFGDRPYYHLLIADKDDEIIGISLYYYGYSTWKGKMLYLDDLVVTEKYRRKGIGKLLFDELVNEAEANNAKQMRWHVLDWNEPAIAFYKKINAHLDPEWITCKMEKEAIFEYEGR